MLVNNLGFKKTIRRYSTELVFMIDTSNISVEHLLFDWFGLYANIFHLIGFFHPGLSPTQHIKKQQLEFFCVFFFFWRRSIEGPVADGQETSGSWTADFCQHFMEHQKQQKLIAKEFASKIVVDMIEMLKQSSTQVEIDIPKKGEVTVCGDIHGQYYDLPNIFAINGVPSEEDPYLFNGDFVDRGAYSVEVILSLFSWKLAFPNHVHLTRGNHEAKSLHARGSFKGEVLEKYDAELYELFCRAFCSLPLCHVINREVFVVHGGLFSQDGVTLETIRNVNAVERSPNCRRPCAFQQKHRGGLRARCDGELSEGERPEDGHPKP